MRRLALGLLISVGLGSMPGSLIHAGATPATKTPTTQCTTTPDPVFGYACATADDNGPYVSYSDRAFADAPAGFGGGGTSLQAGNRYSGTRRVGIFGSRYVIAFTDAGFTYAGAGGGAGEWQWTFNRKAYRFDGVDVWAESFHDAFGVGGVDAWAEVWAGQQKSGSACDDEVGTDVGVFVLDQGNDVYNPQSTACVAEVPPLQ